VLPISSFKLQGPIPSGVAELSSPRLESVRNYLLDTKNEVMLGGNWCDFPGQWTPFTGIESGTYLPAHSYGQELGVVHLLERSNCRSGRFATDVGIIGWNNEHVTRNQAMLL
jgi:hypothetical protein